MRILITGAAGFIASHIADRYIQQGHQVVVIDNMHHGLFAHLNRKAKFYRADIRELSTMRTIMKKERPAVINHHAAIAEVVKSVTDPIPTITTNVQGTVNLLVTGTEVGIKKFIFASTGGAIYGDQPHYPISEQAIADPLSPYGLSKLLAEQCIAYYARQGKFNYVILRYPNVYGPRQDPHGEAGVVAIFAQAMRTHTRPTIFGDGTKTRDYVYVADIAQANVLSLQRGNRLTVNLGIGKEITDQQVYNTIARHWVNPPAVRYKPVRSGEVLRSCLQTKLAHRTLGWKPTYTFAQGIRAYLSTTFT